ncbi:MAG: Nucleoside-diphosphate-sugar pyrophosphorylase [Pedosphaera sp.]|nr:Nucleoside-diphosphate-sugar pyrophosphorylase [Pedosphaera sp.]
MKALLVCPAERPAVPLLQRSSPLVLLPLFGRCLLEYWLEQIVTLGASHVLVSAAHEAREVRALVGNGARWGLKAEVIVESCELTQTNARREYCGQSESAWLAAPNDVTVLDHFPGLPQHPLFQSYAGWFAALLEFLPHAVGPTRIGVRELKPGVWVGMFTRISPTAQLRPPCWIGERVRVGPHSIIGPMAIVEDRVVVESDCEISTSAVGAQTFVGKCTEVRDSLAWGDSLLNWRTESFVTVPDPFLLSALGRPSLSLTPADWLAQLARRGSRSPRASRALEQQLPLRRDR